MRNPEFFGAFTRSAFRLETLPQYLGTSDPAFDEHRRSGQLIPLEQRPAKQAWMAAVQAAVAEGRQMGRVHVVRLPLSDYLRYELATYPENQAAGEDVRIAVVDDHPELARLDRDFWLLDDALALLLDYDPDGRFLSLRESRGPAILASARQRRDLALACSVPLDEFMVEAG